MTQSLPSYADALKAINNGKDPQSFLRLGILYAQGIGIDQNEILAHYFIKKAIDMGCKEAMEYVQMEYESGKKDFVKEIESIIEDCSSITKETIARVRTKAEGERMARNFGSLSRISKHLPLIYPEYNRNKAIDDILNNRNTLDADILYATCTSNNECELFVEQQEKLLQQLFAPAKHVRIDNRNIDSGLLGHDESELAQCLVNLTESYRIICHRYYVTPRDLFTVETLDFFPYIKVKDLSLLRQQGLRCMLSVRDIEPAIRTDYLDNLRDDKALLDICEQIKDQDMQLFLISLVELNIDIESLEINSLQLLRSYRSQNFVPLIEYLNAFVNRLTKTDVKHNLPLYTPENLPRIDM